MVQIQSPEDFKQHVLDNKFVLVDFWAEWCGPCKGMMPALDTLAANTPDLVIAKVNTDQNKALAQTMGIRSIPSLFIFKEGQMVKQITGAQNLAQLTAFVNSAR